MWIQQNYQYLESWCPLKRNCGTLVSAGDTEQFATQAILTPHYWQCSVSQCSDSSTIAKDLNADPGLSTPSSPVRFTGHEDHHQALHHPKNEQPNATDECVVTSLTSERVSRKPTTTKSCKSTSVLDLDPVFVLFVVAYNTIQYVDLSVLPSSLNIIWFQPFWNVFPPYWLLSILVDNKGCRRRRWIAACSILWVDDYIWRTLTSAALWTFALPQLDSARLQKLLTPVNLTKFVPGPESTGTPNQIPQQTTLPIHSGGSDFQGGIGGPSQSGQSGTGNSQFGGSRRPSGAGGPGGTGPNGREGGGAAGGGQRDGDGNEEPNRPEDLLWACHYYKRWPWKHFGCLHQPQKAPRYVKTHLLRKHLQPIHCTICHEAFGTHAEMNAHIVAMSCSRAMGPSPYCDAISNDQRDQLKTLQSAGESEVEKWYKIWDILFPGVQRPPSPYMTGDSSQQMCQFFDEEVYPLYEQTLLQGDVLNGGQIRYAMAVLRNIIDRRAAPPTRGHAPNNSVNYNTNHSPARIMRLLAWFPPADHRTNLGYLTSRYGELFLGDNPATPTPDPRMRINGVIFRQGLNHAQALIVDPLGAMNPGSLSCGGEAICRKPKCPEPPH
ncbi:uncharacterized protein CTRU02_213064 [Colletotrichum truncatum]|uniref:Uncharacterized protein n=1 Tax=Colletotrichum truncatum TaxID=5467 RepID=A0ACC3YJM7_COLTU